MIELHTRARRVGNSWAIIIPKDKAEELHITEDRDLHIDIEPIAKLKELKGKIKFKKSTEQLMKEIDKGWD
jgi:antitoxin component of MazEF toxin-antitoxin module